MDLRFFLHSFNMHVEYSLSCDHVLVKSHICVKLVFWHFTSTHPGGEGNTCAWGSCALRPRFDPLTQPSHPLDDSHNTVPSLSSSRVPLLSAVMPHSRRRKTSLRPDHRLQSLFSFLSIAFHSASFRSIHTFPLNSRDLWILIFYRVWHFLCRILYILFPWTTPPPILYLAENWSDFIKGVFCPLLFAVFFVEKGVIYPYHLFLPIIYFLVFISHPNRTSEVILKRMTRLMRSVWSLIQDTVFVSRSSKLLFWGGFFPTRKKFP